MKDDSSLTLPDTNAAPSVLLALADRCEREAASFGLHCDLAKALGWREIDYDCHIRYVDPADGKMRWFTEMPDWLTSLDAAVTLVPEDCLWAVSALRGGADAHVWGLGADSHADAHVAAMALCAAALRARATLLADGALAKVGEPQ